MGLQIFWFIVIAIFWTGFFVLEGFDFGVGTLHAVVGQDRRRAAGGHQHHRPVLGRQRGLADRGRRRHVRRLPRLVRHLVLGHVPGADARPRRAHRPRRVVRVPRQDRHPRWQAQLERHPDRRPALALPVLFGIALGDLLVGLPIDSDQRVHRHVPGPAHPLRHLGRHHAAQPDPPPRHHVPQPPHHRRSSTSGPAAWPARSPSVAIVAVVVFAIVDPRAVRSGHRAGAGADHRRPRHRRGRMVGQGPPRRLGLRRDGRRHRPDGGDHLHRPLPERDGLLDQLRRTT